MEIKEIKNDGLVIELSMAFGKDDYADKKKKGLNKMRREAEFKGFRKGMVPMSLVEKMYGQKVLSDAINELISESLNKYITDNKLNVLGEPIPSEDEPENDWEKGESFEFRFDLGLAPEVKLDLSKDDKLTHYSIKATPEAKEEYKEGVLKQYSKLELCEEIKAEDIVSVDLIQGETTVNNAMVAMNKVDDAAAKVLFLGKKSGDEFDLNVNEAFPNEADRAALLQVKKEELEGLEPTWHVVIKEVKNFVPAVLGEELYTQMFGGGVVKTEEEFQAKLDEKMAIEYEQQSEYFFNNEVREYLVKKAALKFPEDFLRRWLFLANKGKFTKEQIDKEFEGFIKDFNWQTISQFIMKEQKIQPAKEAYLEEAKNYARYQFQMYGMANVPEESLNQYAARMLEDQDQARRVIEMVENNEVIKYVRSVVTVEEKEVTSAELENLGK
ncbi:MAG: trigger factor [Bacteroidales bacterium]